MLRVDRPQGRATAESRGRLFVIKALSDAARAASASNCDRWEFAVEIEHLLRGADVTELRLLWQQGVVEVAVETTANDKPKRCFEKLSNLSFPARSCFVLAMAHDPLAHRRSSSPQVSNVEANAVGSGTLPRPHWDPLDRTLMVGDRLVKRLRRPAANQVKILDAFEEEGWPRGIYDPLPPEDGANSKRRLHNTINKLNSGLLAPLLRFHGIGDGLSVCWGWADDDLKPDTIAESNPRNRPRRKRQCG